MPKLYTKEQKEELRVKLITLIERKTPFVKICEQIGISETSLKRWFRIFDIRTQAGKQRLLPKIQNLCQRCKKPTKNDNYCSRSCSSYNRLRVKKVKICLIKDCGKIATCRKNLRCDEHHKKHMETRFDYIKELTLEEYRKQKGVEKLPKALQSVGMRTVARYRFRHILKNPCAMCGYNKHVELCHIKPVSNFPLTAKFKEINCEENLIQLCPNCHWEFDHNMISLEDLKKVAGKEIIDKI